jgi:hypothetical protein
MYKITISTNSFLYGSVRFSDTTAIEYLNSLQWHDSCLLLFNPTSLNK